MKFKVDITLPLFDLVTRTVFYYRNGLKSEAVDYYAKRFREFI